MGNKKPAKRAKQIDIDYDNIDVADIMRQIKKKADSISQQPLKDEPQKSKEPAPSIEPLPLPERKPLEISRSKQILLKIMRPFSPLIKLLVLPVHHELRESLHHLDYTNRRLDFLSTTLENNLKFLSHELYKLSDQLNQKIDTFNDSANERFSAVFDRLGSVFERLMDLDRTMEYTKLLHHLAHNTVVELTKLKIEEESLKTKARILEKDFIFLSRREKALEKKAFK